MNRHRINVRWLLWPAVALLGVPVGAAVALAWPDPLDEPDPFADWWNCENFDDLAPSWSDLIANDELIVNGGKSMSFPFQCSTMDGVRHFSESLTLDPDEVCDLLAQHQPPITCQDDASIEFTNDDPVRSVRAADRLGWDCGVVDDHTPGIITVICKKDES